MAPVPPVAATPASSSVTYVTIEVPIAVPTGHIASETLASFNPHIETRMLTGKQRQAMRALHAGLRESHAQFEDGRHVDSLGQTVRYVMEQIGLQMGAK